MLRFALAQRPAPLLNTPDFARTFTELPLDPQQLLREVETVVLPGTKLHILRHTSHPHIVEVRTNEYPYPGPFFTDLRLLDLYEKEPEERAIHLPPFQQILSTLSSLQGTAYIWGGNWPSGIPELDILYPSPDPQLTKTKTLRGVDCTGLIYFATNGFTPRNTSQFISWGQPLSIAGKSLDAICAQVEPLDAIVWKGHIVLVYDAQTTIESRLGKGVVQTPLAARLEEILKTHQPANHPFENHFVIRRWLPAS